MAFKTLADTDSVQTLTNKTLGTGTVISAGSIPSPVFSGTVTGTYTLGGTPTGSLIQTLSTGSTTARSLANRGADVLNVLDYGADKTGVADSTAALQAVALLSDSKAVFFPAGTYKVTDTVVWAAQHTFLFGPGGATQTSIINFQPTATNKVCFQFKAVNPPYNIQVYCGISGLMWSSVGNTQDGKVALEINTNEEFWMDRCRVQSWSGTVKDCVGIRHNGWQLNTFTNIGINADMPIDIHINDWSLATIVDLDFCIFRNCLLLGATTKPCVTIEDGLFISNSSFEHCAFVSGANAVEWIDLPRTITGIADNGAGKCRVTTSAAHTFNVNGGARSVLIRDVLGTIEANGRFLPTFVDSTHFDLLTVPFVHAYSSGGKAYRSPGNSYGLVFDNCRSEQRTDTTKWSYYFDRVGAPIDSIEWRSCYVDSTANGMYLRRVRKASFYNTEFAMISTKTALDFPAESQCSILCSNATFSTGGPKIKIPGFRQMWAGSKPASGAILGNNGLWENDTQDSSSRIHVGGDGVEHRTFTLTLVDDEIFNLQCGSGVSVNMAVIQFFAFGATTKAGGTVFTDTASNVFSSAFTDVGTLCSVSTNVRLSDTDTFFCVYRNSSNIQFRNRLGETVQVIVTIDARQASDITATNLSITETYTVGAAQNFTDIVITDAVSAAVQAQIITTSAIGGTLNTATAGATTSTYDQGIPNSQGVWGADGTVADVNTLLAGLIWTPHANVAVTGCANNGGGKVRVTMPGHGYTGTQTFTITGVTGTVEANITKVSCTFVDADKYDILSVNFVSAYTGGGTVFYAGTLGALVRIHNAKNQIVQGRKSLTPV